MLAHSQITGKSLPRNPLRNRLLVRRKSGHLCPGQTGPGLVLRPDLLLPPGEARLPDLPQHRGLPPRHVPGPAALLRGPGPGNHVHDSRPMAYVQFETNYAEIKVKTGSNNQHTAQLGSTRNETQIMRC